MQVEWVKNGELFHHLETLDTGIIPPGLQGVYLIWQNTSQRVIYGGSGTIRPRLEYHRGNPEILNHRGEGMLLVSWARVDREYMRRVERFLHLHYRPLASHQIPADSEVAVNLPQ